MTQAADHEQNELVRERFTRTAVAFAQMAVPPRAAETERIAELTQAQPADIGLDLACGPGTFTIALARRTRRTFGVDLTPAFLRMAETRVREAGAENVSLLCGDATALPIRDGSFDVAVSGYSFHHMSEPLQALRELARVLRPGGRLAVVDLYTPDGSAPLGGDPIEQARDASHRHTFTRAEFCDAVETAGFRVRATESSERRRLFSEWMRIAGWEPRDPAWRKTRQLMEDDLPRDTSGFHPRLLPAAGNGRPDIEFVQSSLFIGAVKS